MQDLTAHLYPAKSNKIHAQNIQTYSVVGHTVRDHFGTQFTQFTTQVTQFTTQVTQLTTQSRIISTRHADRSARPHFSHRVAQACRQTNLVQLTLYTKLLHCPLYSVARSSDLKLNVGSWLQVVDHGDATLTRGSY